MEVDALIAYLGLAVAGGSLIYVAYTLWPDTIRIQNGMLICRHRFRKESMRLADLESVHFHYQAVVGFAGAWEFIDTSGRSLSVGGYTFRRKLIRQLAQHLPGVSESEFERLFNEGDVEDSLEVWRSDTARKPGGAHFQTS